MTRIDLLRRIEVIANVEPGTLHGDEALDDLDDWDSLAVLGTISLFDEAFGMVLPADRIHDCHDINAIIALAGDRVSG